MDQRSLGKYELQERLRYSSTEETWKAFDTQQHRYVHMRIIKLHPEVGGEFPIYFNQRALAIAALHHPAIVRVQDYALADDGNEAYLVTDYVEGLSLLDYLNATAYTGKIPSPDEIVRLLTPIATALDYAHKQGVIHDALKPTVIVLNKQASTTFLPGGPMLTDFGVYQKRDLRLLSPEDVAYISPEEAQGNARTSRSDLYALGVLLYEVCTGALPFQGETSSDILMQHIHSTPVSPALINPQMRPALTSVIMRSLSREPAARFSSATALVTAVAKALNVNATESLSQSTPSVGGANPRSLSGVSGFLDTMNGPTSLSPLSQQVSSQAPPLPPLSRVQPGVATSNTPTTPVLPPPQLAGSNTPVLPPSQLAGSSTPVFPAPQAVQFTSQNVSNSPIGSSPQERRTLEVNEPARKRRVRLFAIVSVVVLLLVLLSSLLASRLSLLPFSSTSQTTAIEGRAFFVSSGLLSSVNNQGVTDGLQINLQNIPNPQPGKRYYGWLVSTSQIDMPDVALGALSVTHGRITYSYISPQHDNLLANYSRFLITEEDANLLPTSASLDVSTWRYYDAFSTVPNPADPKHFSLVDHLRHLLSQDPKLKAVGLTGGLDIWLYKNTTKILEAAGSARDSQKVCMANPSPSCTDFVLRQVARILDYLDGAAYIQTENIPPSIQGKQLLIDPVIARVALLEFDAVHQEPPGYLTHIGSHLQEISQIAAATPEQRALAVRIHQAINNVQGWLNAVHADAASLIHMSSAQLIEPGALTLLNDLFTQANAAFVGQIDPNTNNVKEGVVQIHYNIQALATFEVAPCIMSNGKSSCA